MKRILCLGDSNTWGYDPRSWFGSQYPAHVRWTGLLERAGWQVLNCGQNGLSIPGEVQISAFENLIRSRLPADVITIMLGSNDILEGRTAEEAAARMVRFLDCVQRAAPGVPVLLIAPPVMKEGTWVQGESEIDESAELAGRYRALAEQKGIFFADAEEWGIEVLFDGVHFSPVGHRSFANGLQKTLREILRRNGETE